MFEFVGDISHHFVAWQVRWQAFVPLLTRFATPVSRDQIGFFDRVCQARGRIVRFVGVAEIKTPTPEFVLYLSEVVDYVRKQSAEIISCDQLQLCVGRLETARLAVTGETDLEHIRNVERWHGHRG